MPGPSVIVVGGGAAGLTAAFFAASHGARVRVLEKNPESGKKILISGGTRCNVLPVRTDLGTDYFTSSNRSAMEAVFRSWDLQSCHHWLTSPDGLDLDLAIEHRTQKYFPKSNKAKDVRDALLHSCLEKEVVFEYSSDVRGVVKQQNGNWSCVTRDHISHEAQRVIMASGGMSFPKVGTEGSGFKILKKLGHTITPPFPALTPLLAEHPGGGQFAGMTLKASRVTAENPRTAERCQSMRGGLLFTHRGYSGPAILDVSHLFTREGDRGSEIHINWTMDSEEDWRLRFKEANWKGTMPKYLKKFGIPLRLAIALCQESEIPEDRRMAHLKKKEKKELLERLMAYSVLVKGHEGFKLAEVTGGGVPLEEVETESLESKKAKGVFICGELMDVFGRIGGFNFYWAWVSGRLAGIQSATTSPSALLARLGQSIFGTPDANNPS